MYRMTASVVVAWIVASSMIGIKTMAADGDPVVAAEVSITVESMPESRGRIAVATDNPFAEARRLDVELAVVDFFQKPVASVTRTLDVAPGKQTVDMGAFPAEDAKRFRADLRWRPGDGQWQKTHAYADVDYVASGPRHSRRIDAGTWQRMALTESPQGDPHYPPQGQWTPTSFPLKPEWSDKSHWTWFKQELAPQRWLSGERIKLRISQAEWHSHVYVNGTKVGAHMVACTPFSFDVTEHWRPGETNVIEIAVGDLTTTYADFSKDMSFNMLTPVYGHGGSPGIWEGVYLVAHSPAHVADVLVMPSVKRGELRVRTGLSNRSDRPAEMQLVHTVEDEGQHVFSLPAETVSLPPGEARTVETTRPWTDARLWWPHSPHLYRLRTRVTADGAIIDEVSTRFGFREVSIDGVNLLLNGRIFRPFGKSSAGEGPGVRQPSRGVIAWWMEPWNIPYLRVDQPWLMRLHVQVRPAWYAELADEMGVCLLPETGFCSTVYYAFEDPRFWRNTTRHAVDLVMRDRNSPSVIYWSAGNEVILAAGASKTPLEDYIGGCKKVIAAMKEADPTRPVVYEGGMDETAEIIDLHYPRSWYNNVDFPNSTYWLKPGVMTESFGGQTPTFIWKGDRPVTVGEEGQLFTTQPPHDMATFMGDVAYRETIGYAASARFRALDDMIGAGYLEGYRRTGVVRMAPDLGASGGPKMNAAMKLVRTFVQPRDECFLSGSKVERTITIFHDVLVPEKLTLTWNVMTANGESVADGKRTYELDAGETRHLPISWRTPEVETPLKLVLATRLTGEQGLVFAEEHEYTVYRADPLSVPAGARIGLYDPAGATEKALAGLGVTGLEKVDTLTRNSLSGLAALIVGEDLRPEPDGAKDAMDSLLQSGGKLIMLHQTGQTSLKWSPVPGLTRTAGIEHTYCFARDWAHPLLAGLDDSLLRLWSSDHVVSKDALLKVTGGRAIPIIDAGGPNAAGLSYAPVTEIVLPQGSIVLCQLDAVQKAAIHPGARRFLRNILNYAAAPACRQAGPVGIIAGSGSVVRPLIGELGIETKEVSGGGLEQVRAVVVDAEGIEGHAQNLRTFAEQGGTVLVKGFTPSTQDRFGALFPKPLELVADRETRRPVQDRRDPLISGIGNEELCWERRTEQFARTPEKYAGIPVYAYLIKPGPEMVSLYRTEVRDNSDKLVESRGSGLVKVPAGKGWIVVDQTRWEAVHEPQPAVWGNKTPFAAGLKRYVSMLLTNLGALTE